MPRPSLSARIAIAASQFDTDHDTTIAKDDYSAAPLLGLTLSHRY
jgi:hypothetical protein